MSPPIPRPRSVCGSRFGVDVTPHWREPLMLWRVM